jgi:hypothetical protein
LYTHEEHDIVGVLSANAFHEKAGRSQVGWFCFLLDMVFILPSGLTDAILPSALLMSDFSLGASWAFSFAAGAATC